MSTYEFEEKAKVYRKKIDKIDEQIIKLLNHRFQSCENIAKLKKQMQQPVHQPKRSQLVIKKRVHMAVHDHNLNPIFIERFFRQIIKESCRIQKHIINTPT